MGNWSDLIVYKKAFALAMEIFEISKRFPPTERFDLVSQIRRSSRSVISCLAEGYRKRSYRNYFISKLSDGEAENCETQVWLEFANACKYITAEQYNDLTSKNSEVGKLLHFMVHNPDKFRPSKSGKN